MAMRRLMCACLLALAGCADYHIPLSTTDPPPANAAVDQHCMDDCLGDKSDPGFCHDRCAK
jgi:hypothetical protein